MQFKICKGEINYKKLNPKNWKRLSFKKVVKGFAFFIIFLAALIIIKYEYEYQFETDTSEVEGSAVEDSVSDEESDCNVLGIELRGNVVTYVAPKDKDEEDNNTVDETSSEDIIYLIDQANTDDNIKAIILEVDSYGGSAVAAEEINQALQSTDKPTVAFVRSAAASAAYWAASGADTIFASPLSDIGSIGVTMSYLDNTKKNAKDGLTYNSLSAGKFKDYGNPDKILTEDEKKLIMRDLNITHDIFINTVSKNRNLPIEKVKSLADGSSMPGQMALENGLIDQLGDIYKVQNYLKDKLGEDVEVCWY